jgi:uncharacterized protein
VSSFFVAPILAWIVAQGAKYILASIKRGDFKRVARLYETGGMPSSHTAIVVALMMVTGALEGTDSAVFAISTALAVIVIHDALQVRRSSGEQGAALRELLIKAKVAKLPHQAFGHTPQEVFAGALVGLVSALVALSF